MVSVKQNLLFMIAISVFMTGYYYMILQSISEVQSIKLVSDLRIGVCEVIHLGIVCITQSSKLNFYPMLKSIFINRNNPIHFHIIVNNKTNRCLSKLFQTWLVPQVEVSFYNINEISSKNYSKILSTFKSILSKLFQLETVKKVILLSTNIIFNEDIYELWRVFKQFHKRQILGIPLKEFQEKDESSDADIVLFHLDNLRQYGWISTIEHTVSCDWNSKINCSKFKFNVINQNRSEYISSLLLSLFANYDGNEVRKINNNCSKELQLAYEKQSITNNNICDSFPESKIHLKRTLLYFYDYMYVSSDMDVTLVSQLSFHKINILEELAVRWEGPMSLAVYLSDTEYIKCREFIQDSQILKNRLNIGYHAVFKDGSSHHINYLRNVALNEVNTPYVFFNDMDLIPIQNLYTVIKSYLNNTEDMTKKALIVPAFQTRKEISEIPSTMKELIKMWDETNIVIFKIKIFPHGHLPTNYEKWRIATNPYKVQWKYEYEPYIVVKSDVINFDERFFAYGWDKIAHIMELKMQGYEFIVLPNTFVVHKYHKITQDRVTLLTSRKFYLCLKSIKKQFKIDLKKRYRKIPKI